MRIGMLWFDDSKKTLAEKVARAAEYYVKKYGRVPNQCYVNPKECEAVNGSGIAVAPLRTVRPNHFWIGARDG